MNCFEKMIEDIFNVPQFTTFFYTEENKEIVTVAYETSVDPVFSEYGIENGVSFYLTCKTHDYQPKKGDKITYKNKKYKVENFTADSFNLTYNIFLKDLSSK